MAGWEARETSGRKTSQERQRGPQVRQARLGWSDGGREGQDSQQALPSTATISCILWLSSALLFSTCLPWDKLFLS